MGDSAQDKQRCAESLTGVATCLPYLGGDTKAPTADCCSGLTQAMKTNKKCVCLILKDRDDPDLGLKINMTIAVGLPSLCKTPDNLSQCSVEGSSQNGKNQGTDETATAKNSASYIGKRFLESLVAVAGLLIWLS
ncbi:Protein YLS3 isoform B [Glycine soja]|uniref:Protein YLS3 isoform B n=1 Tax=Glycine soja TaxID=3848 RepID=A0A445GKD3_GLYSO|nr:Protein YLS3 isoform B [Glycine soja]